MSGVLRVLFSAGYLNRAGSSLGSSEEEEDSWKCVLWPCTPGGHYHLSAIDTMNEVAMTLHMLAGLSETIPLTISGTEI